MNNNEDNLIRDLITTNFFNEYINYEKVDCFGKSCNLIELDREIILPTIYGLQN